MPSTIDRSLLPSSAPSVGRFGLVESSPARRIPSGLSGIDLVLSTNLPPHVALVVPSGLASTQTLTETFLAQCCVVRL
jgi:hypothetical protein